MIVNDIAKSVLILVIPALLNPTAKQNYFHPVILVFFNAMGANQAMERFST